MDNLILQSLENYTKTFIGIFLMVLLGLSYLFAREKFVNTIVGFFLGLVSIFYSPFLYLQKKFLRLTEFGEQKEKEFEGKPHYLLHKAILFFEILLVAGSVSIISSAFIAGCNEFLPPQWQRDKIEYLENEISDLDSILTETKDKTSAFDAEWESKKAQAINDYKKNMANQIKTLQNEYNQIASELNNLDETQSVYVKAVKDSLRKTASSTDENAINNVSNSLFYYLDNEYYLEYSVKYPLQNLINKWVELKRAQLNSNTINEESIRFTVQPEYHYIASRVMEIETRLNDRNVYLKKLKDELKYNFNAMFLSWFLHILAYIAFIWGAGLVIELLGLSVHLATNVHEIKSLLKERSNKA